MNLDRTPLIEPWVDAATVGAHLGFKSDHIRKLARAGKIPGVQMGNGAKAYWRFKLSAVDAAHAAEQRRIARLSPIPTTEHLNIVAPEVLPFVYREASAYIEREP